MDREDVIIAALGDPNSSDFLRKGVIQLPPDVFTKTNNRKIFKHFKSGKDVMELNQEDLEMISEIIQSDTYKIFKSSDEKNKEDTIDNLLAEFKKESAIKIVDSFQLNLIKNINSLEGLTHKLMKDLSQLPAIDKAVSIWDAMAEARKDAEKFVELGQSPITSIKEYPKLCALFNLGFRQEETVGLLGETGGGKTTLLQNITYYLYSRGKKVLYLSTEMNPKSLATKIGDVIAHKTKIPGYYSNVWVEAKKAKDLEMIYKIESFRDEMPFKVVHTRSVEKMVFEIYREDYDYVFIDHIHDIPGARNSDSSISIDPLFTALDAWKASTGGIAFVALQSRKVGVDNDGNKRDLTKEDVYGSQAIISNITSLLGVSSDKINKTAKVLNLKSRWGGTEGDSTVYRFDNGVFVER